MKIEIQELNMIYRTGKKALQNINLNLESPNFIGLLGPNGAGKSTLMKLLVAGISPTSGKIILDNKPLSSTEKTLKSQLGYLPQNFGLYDELTVYQFLDYMAALKGIKNTKSVILDIIEQTNLTEKKKAKIKTLSGGQRQRIGIAQALLGNPQLLIFDEPTVGLDPEERLSFRNLFSKKAQDKIILLSTHIIEDVQSVCNRLIILHHGIILFDGTPSDLILRTKGHVGIFMEQNNEQKEEGYQVTARVNTAQGILCRIVAENLPNFVKEVEPSLEDAYLYFIAKGES